ncbi:hypothetical protein GCM10018962_86480 [Dactylosporangium matsuzakiense]|uniref:Uncharacterized protein n=1 Tax=Dactylosporangium matsuzakiense TaxID=53360 RepID=A0A9W6KPW6_9ACTN|nr:hypothetical protein GCM10017581_059820 [Dactylosporangium matsuzakiense]
MSAPDFTASPEKASPGNAAAATTTPANNPLSNNEATAFKATLGRKRTLQALPHPAAGDT